MRAKKIRKSAYSKSVVGIVFMLSGTISTAATVTSPTLISTGDSYTRRTPCGQYVGSYDGCDSAGVIKHEQSYATYLNAVSKYQIVPTDNSARGGETCTLQTPYQDGIWAGSNRGLAAQVDTRINNRVGDHVSILIGINDVNLYGVLGHELQECLQTLYSRVTASGKKVIAMTYPGVSPSTNVWGTGNGWLASYNVSVVNTAIRNAVSEHNRTNPSSKVLLAETSSAWTSDGAAQFTEDGAHPNATGARHLARVWFDLVCRSGEVNCRTWFQ